MATSRIIPALAGLVVGSGLIDDHMAIRSKVKLVVDEWNIKLQAFPTR